MPLDPQRLIRAVGAMLAEHEEQTAQAIAEVREEVTAAIAALPAPEPGPRGRDGEDGIDRVLVAPATVDPDQRCPRNEVIHHKDGIWQAIRETAGDPDHDPAGWKCLVPGIAGYEGKVDYHKRLAAVTFRTSDGRAHEIAWRLPSGYLPLDWRQRGWGIIAGDILRDGDHDYVALIDAPGSPLDQATAANWQKMQVIGRRGHKGEPGRKGDPGEPGPGLEGMSLVRDPSTSGVAILPVYADKRINPEPIAVDLMTEPSPPGRLPIVGYAGAFHTSKRYGRGDIVSAHQGEQRGLWLSLKPDNREQLSDTGSWERML